MKKLIVLLVISLFVGAVYSQTEVRLTIKHKLGNMDFKDTSSVVYSGTDSQYYLKRIEYYISQITLTDGDDNEIKLYSGDNLKDRYILVRANGASSTYIISDSNFPINASTIKKIKFAVGVDSQTNHLDPAQYNTFHPLALKVPSMHWGWAGGYRFLALEGKAGKDFKQVFELHGVGNENYFHQEHIVNTDAKNGVIDIVMIADYRKTLDKLDLASGLVSHGTTASTIALKSFGENSFKSEYASSSIIDLGIEIPKIWSYKNTIYVNPQKQYCQIEIYDMTGQEVDQLFVADIYAKQIETSGIYFVKVTDKNGLESIKKVFIE